MDKTQYFCLKLTENEHYVVEDMIKDWCSENGGRLIYYRVLKDGHVPMIREIKIDGIAHGTIERFLLEKKLTSHIVKNPHKEE